LPVLTKRSSASSPDFEPKSYKKYVETWKSEEIEVMKREQSENDSAETTDGNAETLDPIVAERFDEMVSASSHSTVMKPDGAETN
jgi:hypothetical protein